MYWKRIVTTLLLAVGVSCQKIAWESSYVSKSKCTAGGLLIGQESFMMQGTASPADLFMAKKWSNEIKFQISYPSTAGTFTAFCQATVHDGSFCTATSYQRCFCTKVFSNVTYFVVNLTAEPTYSNAILRAMWYRDDGSKTYIHSDVKLPRMYNLSDARFAINNENSSLVSSACDITVRNDRKSSFCCDTEATPTPCNPKLNFGGTMFRASGNNSCVEAPAYQGIFNYTLSVCGHDTFGYCVMTVLDVTTTILATATTGGQASANSDNDLVLILVVILGLAILLLIGCAILVFCLHKKKKGDDNIKTAENPEPGKETVEETQNTKEETQETVKDIERKSEVEEGEGTVVE